MQEQTNKAVEVLKPQNITKKSLKRQPRDLPKYWDKIYINEKLRLISNYKHKMLFKFLWMSGVRITEAVSLLKGGIDFDNYTMRVRWLKSRKYKQRIVPLHPVLKDILQVYTANMKADDRVFPISRQRAWVLCKKYLGGSPHQLRHSFAVNWLRSDVDIVVLHRVLGHSSIKTTMEYLNIVPIDQGKELLKIDFG